MSKPQVGNPFPHFILDCYSSKAGIEKIDSSSLAGKVFVLAFYPKDSTPVCTKEMCAFRDDWSDFTNKGIEVFGISQDSIKSHESFSAKYELASLKLLSDAEGTLSNDLSVGAELPKRTLFIIDKKGIIQKIIEGMPNNNELLEFCKSL